MAQATAQRPQQQQQRPAQQAPREIDPNAALLDDVLARTLDNMEKLSSRYGTDLDNPDMGSLRRAAMTGIAITRLRTYFTPALMDLLRGLMNTPLGFRTDRPSKNNPSTYPDEVIRDCAIEALLRGALWTGNEFNIIADRCYLTKEYYIRKLAELPDFTDLRPTPGIPRIDKDSGQTVIRFAASWRYKGKPDALKDHEGKPGRVFAIRVNQGMGADAVIGKAERKAYKAIWDYIHGSTHSPDYLADEDPVQLPQAQESKPTNGTVPHQPPAPLAAAPLTPPEVETLNGLAGRKGQALDGYLKRYSVKFAGQFTREQAGEVEAELMALPDVPDVADDAADNGEVSDLEGLQLTVREHFERIGSSQHVVELMCGKYGVPSPDALPDGACKLLIAELAKIPNAEAREG